MSHHEEEEAHPQDGPSGENRHPGALPEPGMGLVSTDDLVATGEATVVIMKMGGSFRGCS